MKGCDNMQDLEWRLRLEEREDGVVISTIKTPFLKWYDEYEIAISIDNFPWHVCFSCDNKKEVLLKHEEYAKMTKDEIIKIYNSCII